MAEDVDVSGAASVHEGEKNQNQNQNWKPIPTGGPAPDGRYKISR